MTISANNGKIDAGAKTHVGADEKKNIAKSVASQWSYI